MHSIHNQYPKKKIFINGRFFTQDITGVQRYAHELIREIDRLIGINEIPELQHYAIVLVVPKRKIKHSMSFNNITVKKCGIFSSHLWEQIVLPFVSRGGLLFCPGNTAPVISLLLIRNVITTIHDLSYRYYPEAYSRLFKLYYRLLIPLVIRFSKYILTVSNSELQQIIKYYPSVERKICAIQNGGLPSESQFSHSDIQTNEIRYLKPFILYIGALSLRKNINGVIDAFNKLVIREKFNLVIVGAAPKAFIKFETIVENHVRERIHLLGQLNGREEIIQLYRNALCLVFPSYYEASPLPPIEAMACGCPVVCSDIPALKERCGDAALYSKPDDSEKIIGNILLVGKDKIIREALIEKGFARAKYFSWLNCAKETCCILIKQI